MYKNIIFDLGGVMVDFDPKTYLVDRFCNAEVEEQVSQLTFESEEWKLLGRDETLVIPWTDIETLGVDAILVRMELPEPEAKSRVSGKNCGNWLDGLKFFVNFPVIRV